jgi:hypothetical protein
MHGWAPEVIGAVGRRETEPAGIPRRLLRPHGHESPAGQEASGRIFGRTANRDEPCSWQTRLAQYDAICAWGIPNHALLERVTGIQQAVLIANGDSDR